MMMNKRLINLIHDSKKYIAGNVAFQWCSLLANILLMFSITNLLAGLLDGSADGRTVMTIAIAAAAALIVRYGCTIASARMGYLSSKAVKQVLREKIYQKLLRLGTSYNQQVKTSEVVQVAVEGVEQLETYFGAYLPQFFYAMLAPLTLFAVLSFISLPAAIVLFICVPLIPVSIVIVQKIAKKLLAKYWGEYTKLGDTFLENLQGLTTLKIYQADAFKHEEMNAQAERFRKITMKVLTMQLNSIIVMDIIAYGGAALGVILSAAQFAAGNINFSGALLIILLSADFFIPMRQLGSFFHIAMNGMAASDKIFRVLDLPETTSKGTKTCPQDCTIQIKNLDFAYDEERQILDDINLSCPKGSFTAFVGESGCGKSTLAGLLMGKNKGYAGSITVGGIDLADISEESLMKNFTYISHQSYLFKGTVRENLLMGNPKASEEELWAVLERVNLAAFLRSEGGLDTELKEKASNLSGGQCQRLALARALLHDSPVYVFDEATSNIDVESENDIMKEILHLAQSKTVILISHRLANVVNADHIYVLETGRIAESGNHTDLLCAEGVYAKLWNAQQTLEQYTKEGGAVQ